MAAMPSHRSPTSAELLHELMPCVERSLDRHIGAAAEWFPHEYVPYAQGRDYVEEPWRETDSGLPDPARTALEVNLLTEDNLPYYHLGIWQTFGNDEAWGEWVRRWTAEEGRHSILLRDYLSVTRGIDPARLERGRMDMVVRGWYPGFSKEGPLDGVIFLTLQELATRISHRNTGETTRDERLRNVCGRIATDENLHYVFYRDVAREAIQVDPSAAILAMHRQIIGFKMPGSEMPDFRAKAKTIARSGIYNLRIHLDQVLTPVLDKQWRIWDASGLSDEAARAREDIANHLERLARVAARLDEPPGPVTGDLTDDPVGVP